MRKKLNMCKTPFLQPLALGISGFLSENIHSKVQSWMEKTRVLSPSEIRKEEAAYVVTSVRHICLGLFGAMLLGAGIMCLPGEKDSHQVVRPEVNGEEKTIEVLVDTDGKEETVPVKVMPRELTKEEFNREADETEKELQEFFKQQVGAEGLVTKSLKFPQTNAAHTVNIRWSSDRADLIGESGRLYSENIKENTEINVSAFIFNDTFEREVKFRLTAVQEEEDVTGASQIQKELQSLEEKYRGEKEWLIPEQIGESHTRIKRESEKSKYLKLLFLMIFMVFLYGGYRFYQLREEVKEKNNQLLMAFHAFVTRLTIFIGAGMTIRKALQKIQESQVDEFLKAKIRGCLNMMDSGMSEEDAIVSLGKSTGLPEYMRLMSLVAENVRVGNTNLLQLMDMEVRNSSFTNKELIRKRGEQASEKLMMPSLLLMMVVMGIVVVPTFLGF